MAADVGGRMAQQPSSVPSKLPNPRIQPCRYKTGRTLGAGSYSVVKECVHTETGRYYAAKVINKRLMAGREHMVRQRLLALGFWSCCCCCSGGLKDGSHVHFYNFRLSPQVERSIVSLIGTVTLTLRSEMKSPC